MDAARATQLLGALVDKSILTASFPDVERATTCSTPSASTPSSSWPRPTTCARPSWCTPSTSRPWLTPHGPSFAGPTGWPAPGDWSWSTTTSGQRWPTRATRPTRAIAVRLGGGWAGTSPSLGGSPRGAASSKLRLRPRSDDALVGRRIELLAFLCYLATEELDLAAAIDAGDRALAVAAAASAPSESALARGTLSLALALFGDNVRAAALAEEARTGYGAAGDHWGVAASSLVRAQGAVHAGDISTVATMTAEILRHSEAIGYDAFVVPAMLLEAWLAELRNEPGAAEDAYRRALELAERIGFADHVSFALVRLGSIALARGDTGQAEELCRRALAMAEAASTSRLAAHARVQLARVLEAAGDADTAETLYRSVVQWSHTPRPRQVRESLFVVLAGSPGAAALRGLARLAAARGHHDAADDLQAHAAAIAERDRGAGR